MGTQFGREAPGIPKLTGFQEIALAKLEKNPCEEGLIN